MHSLHTPSPLPPVVPGCAAPGLPAPPHPGSSARCDGREAMGQLACRPHPAPWYTTPGAYPGWTCALHGRQPVQGPGGGP